MFNDEVIDKLKSYVYRLIDPRNGETFYVGKGKGNRVFAHINGEYDENGEDQKLKRIWQIKNLGLEVIHVIHRHGLDEKTAFQVEAALLDAYPGVTNLVGGHGSKEFGPANATELMRRYSAPTLEIKHKVLFINVNASVDDYSVYEAVRFAWRLNIKKAAKAEVVLAVQSGLVIGAFIVDKWLPATIDNFPGKENIPGRYGFIGVEANTEIKNLYVGKRIPEKYRRRGAANPIKYGW